MRTVWVKGHLVERCILGERLFLYVFSKSMSNTITGDEVNNGNSFC